jgi:hypothetical protein
LAAAQSFLQRAGNHNHYSDFLVHTANKDIEVMGVGTEEYWKKQGENKLVTENYPEIEILIITSYTKKARTHIGGMPRVNILIWRELEKVANWCWENAPG